MCVTAVLVLLLCSWSLSLADGAAALNDDVALADGDVGANDDVATLLDRMNTLERRVSERDSFLLSEQEQLKTKLLHQESLNRELATRLARQDGMLVQQGRLIQQLRSVAVSPASSIASRASATASRASSTASRASATASLASSTASRVSFTASRTSATAPVFHHDNVDDVEDMTGPDTQDSGKDSTVSGRNRAKRSPSTSGRSVAKRSDNGGPLEAVVNQISQRVTEMGAELRALQNSDRQQESALQDARTSTFVRWGSSTCGGSSSSSSLVYAGVVGGSSWNHSGAATNFLCLTPAPVFTLYAPVGWVAYLLGAEYNSLDSHHDKDPLCAVCRAAFSTTLMVPGTDACSPGWHRHYSGYLMTGHRDAAAGSEYICVDAAMESAAHTEASEDGKLLEYTVTRCGSLPCGPYVNDTVVMCAVCSK